ncbi:MAG: PAS domain S-box protein, partial [Chloroflexota bacterium]
MTEELKGSHERLQAELGARKRAEARLVKLNECLLGFGADPDENINRLVAFCGEQLQATCALYNRLEGDTLYSLGQWNTPPDYNPVDKPDGHICYDVIRDGEDDARVIRDLLQTSYAQTDPNVVRYGLQTYVGKAVSFGGAFVGSLCVVYQEDRTPGEDDLNLLGIAASAVGVEEKRKQAEEALRQAEEKYRSIFENAVEGIFQTTLDGHYRLANPALARIYGHEAPEELMATVTDLNRQFYVEPGRRAEFIQLMEEHEAVWGFESKVYRKDGSIIWISENLRAIRDAGGRIVGFEGTTEDITERKQAGEELTRLRKAVETSGETIFLTDRDGLITYVNPEFARFYGYTAAEVIGKTTPRILKSGLLKPEDYEIFWETLLNKQVVKGEIINKTKDGRLVTVEGSANPILDEQENILGFLAIQRDITERRRAEEALQESEKRFRSLFEDSPISLWEEDFSLVATYLDELRHSGVTDFRAYFEDHLEAVAHCATMVKVIDINKGTLKLYKANSKEAFLAGLNVVFSEESTSTFREELIALAEGKARFEGEVINQTLTGDKIHVALSWSVAPGNENASRRLFVSIIDITARKQAEEKLAVKVAELEQRNNENTLLNEMGDLLQSSHTVEEASAVVSQFARQLFPHQSGALCLIAPSRNLVDAITTWGEFPPQDRIFTPDDCWALRRGQTHWVTDPGSGLLCRHVSRRRPCRDRSRAG